jgi:hypothetical protein
MLRLFVLILFATTALTFSANSADWKKKPRPADWGKICEDRGHGRPACKTNCKPSGPTLGCSIAPTTIISVVVRSA